jgi:hypothetical protein
MGKAVKLSEEAKGKFKVVTWRIKHEEKYFPMPFLL